MFWLSVGSSTRGNHFHKANILCSKLLRILGVKVSPVYWLLLNVYQHYCVFYLFNIGYFNSHLLPKLIEAFF